MAEITYNGLAMPVEEITLGHNISPSCFKTKVYNIVFQAFASDLASQCFCDKSTTTSREIENPNNTTIEMMTMMYFEIFIIYPSSRKRANTGRARDELTAAVALFRNVCTENTTFATCNAP